MPTNIFKVFQNTITWMEFQDGSQGDISHYSRKRLILTNKSYQEVNEKFSDIIDIEGENITKFTTHRVNTLKGIDIDDYDVQIVT